MEKPYLDLICSEIPEGMVLDVGCGSAEPIAKYFIENNYAVTGVDFSEEMIKICQERYPDENWIIADMQELELHSVYDIVIAWHSFFHIQQDQQKDVLKRLIKHVKTGGILAFTSGTDRSVEFSDNGGEQLYHASLSTSEYKEILTQSGCTVLRHAFRDPDCGGATVWVCKKI